MSEVNCRGLACPSPVINTKKALDNIESGTVTTIVDNAIARDNVAMFARNSGYQVSVDQQGNEYYITVTKGDEQIKTSPAPASTLSEQNNQMYFISSDSIGKGSDELGTLLMRSFIFTLTEIKPVPAGLIFVNAGVRLTTEHSPVLEHLHTLQNNGTVIISCGTCLDYYGLKEKLVVGKISNMYDIVEYMSGASKVINVS
ncbi:SirA family protein [Desulfofarcimen acetoxidans DSM 771]|uniref:SirA family protein n=1 Tax=Desulfofarcimen acetoxidans (strain ATCC 49208 / DSM 771 / KCTC 5769 / VKM B-1644 / 5575) TaxID=485916 RepID=C8W3P3_DESAS|nr:sulfurtransferase-like selenium metabolism protein YedF [Desulfofarcimen acetoxidans]ACV63829.1 SirA family protein [Desulfofarcimen acetoxidans DSM 771]